jgi:rare lipoprotein A
MQLNTPFLQVLFCLRCAPLNDIFKNMQFGNILITNLRLRLSSVATGAIMLASAFLFCACSGHVPPPPQEKPKPAAGMPRSQRPYQIYGIWYYPIPSAQGYKEDGIASWYGDIFHGKATSSGEVYNMYGMTAAHKVLPLGTHVKVTNKNNGQSVILRVNDRGPFVAGRIIDLSYTAAQKLGMLQPGTIPVRVETVQVAQQEYLSGKTVWKAEAVPDFRVGNFSIQVGAFLQAANAGKFQETMKLRYAKVSIQPPTARDRESERYYRVQVGSYKDLLEAQKEADRLKKNGYPGAFVVATDEQKS